MEVDHINRNKLDNRRENLRICSRLENVRNTGLRTNNSSGVIGVYYRERFKKWHASIRINGKAKSLGYYHDKKDAIAARKRAEIKYFGEFAPKYGSDETIG